MMILVTYDVNTMTEAGARRLHRVAKQCQRYGVRVQCSVFECQIDTTQYTALKHALLQEIDPAQDSIRLYRLGERAASKIEVLGVSRGLSTVDALIF